MYDSHQHTVVPKVSRLDPHDARVLMLEAAAARIKKAKDVKNTNSPFIANSTRFLNLHGPMGVNVYSMIDPALRLDDLRRSDVYNNISVLLLIVAVRSDLIFLHNPRLFYQPDSFV
jgi:hypothetical protein